jgi:KDO2-lipid IV(A) lauroyltransferase
LIWLFKSFSVLPLPVLHALGYVLGILSYLVPGRHARNMRTHIHASGLCRGHDCTRLLWRNVVESGKGMLELAAVWMRPQAGVVRLVREVRGKALLDTAISEGHGVVLMSPHIGCFEIVNQYLSRRMPFTAMYRPARKASMDAIMLAGRQRGQARLVPTTLAGVKQLLAALKRGEAIGVLPDQVASLGEGVWAPFFGRWAYTPTLPFRLAQSTGAALIMIYAERLGWGRGFRIHITRLTPPDLRDRSHAAHWLNHEVERVIAHIPAQYMWSYARYKQPGGAPPPPADAPH